MLEKIDVSSSGDLIKSYKNRASEISRGHGAKKSGKSAKSRLIHKKTQNTAKFGRNLIKYMSVQYNYLKLI